MVVLVVPIAIGIVVLVELVVVVVLVVPITIGMVVVVVLEVLAGMISTLFLNLAGTVSFTLLMACYAMPKPAKKGSIFSI